MSCLPSHPSRHCNAHLLSELLPANAPLLLSEQMQLLLSLLPLLLMWQRGTLSEMAEPLLPYSLQLLDMSMCYRHKYTFICTVTALRNLGIKMSFLLHF